MSLQIICKVVTNIFVHFYVEMLNVKSNSKHISWVAAQINVIVVHILIEFLTFSNATHGPLTSSSRSYWEHSVHLRSHGTGKAVNVFAEEQQYFIKHWNG